MARMAASPVRHDDNVWTEVPRCAAVRKSRHARSGVLRIGNHRRSARQADLDPGPAGHGAEQLQPGQEIREISAQIGEELGVRYLLTGTVEWEQNPSGRNRVKVSPELIEVSTASAKWQQPFDAVLNDVFQVQADIASQVAQALGVALGSGTQEQLSERPTASLGAYEAFLRGEALNEGSGGADPVSMRRAVAYYEQAVALDPTFVQAWSELSRAHSRLYYVSVPTSLDADGHGRRPSALCRSRPIVSKDTWPLATITSTSSRTPPKRSSNTSSVNVWRRRMRTC